MQIRCGKDVTFDLDGYRTSELSYRRGVVQTLYLVAQLVRGGVSARDLDQIADLAQSWRYDHQPHLAFLDELISEWRRSKPKKPAATPQW